MVKKPNPVNNKEVFKRWLSTRVSRAGRLYSPGTPKSYVAGLNSSYKEFKEEYGSYHGVFEINDPAEFDKIVKAIKAKKVAYSKYMRGRGGRYFSAASTQYRKFLDGEGPNPGDYSGGRYSGKKHNEKHPKASATLVDNRKEFEKWLSTRTSGAGMPYSPGTPKSYVTGLNSSYKVFKEEYGSHHGAFEINDPEEFAKIVKAIKDKKVAYSKYRKERAGLFFAAATKMYMGFLVEKMLNNV